MLAKLVNYTLIKLDCVVGGRSKDFMFVCHLINWQMVLKLWQLVVHVVVFIVIPHKKTCIQMTWQLHAQTVVCS